MSSYLINFFYLFTSWKGSNKVFGSYARKSVRKWHFKNFWFLKGMRNSYLVALVGNQNSLLHDQSPFHLWFIKKYFWAEKFSLICSWNWLPIWWWETKTGQKWPKFEQNLEFGFENSQSTEGFWWIWAHRNNHLRSRNNFHASMYSDRGIWRVQ